MRLSIRKRAADKVKSRTKKRVKIRKRVSGSSERPRICVFKSARNIYAQMIDDESGKTLVSASTKQDKITTTGKDAAFEVGKKLAEKAKAKNIEKAVFDRSGYLFHGRIQKLADGAREGGLKF